jgi:hypothetical protein
MDLGDVSHEYNLLSFTILQHIGKMATIELVQVINVTGGGLNPIGTVDVQPMVNQIDGNGSPTAHGTIYGLPYFRIQGGTSAVINDPVVGDIGMAAFSSRDISKVKNTGAIANPGSRRRFDWADGLYLGCFIGAAPTRYVMMSSAGLNVVDPTQVEITAPTCIVNGNVTLGGSSGGAGVARIGDAVSGGVITGGSTKVFSL